LTVRRSGWQNRRPLYVGEFGTYQEADIASRVRWTRAVVSEARKARLQLSFGVYDQIALTWCEPLLGPKSGPLAI
jgi:endoglucanase